jgi:flagellar hook-associated protein 2
MGTTNIGGLVSGVRWNDLVDQVTEAERARSVAPLQTQLTAGDRRKTAWDELSGLVGKLQGASDALRLGSAFTNFSAVASPSTLTNRALVSVSANAGARPGSYKVEVVELARAEKLSSSVVADATLALGLSGTFAVAGQTVTLAGTDSLEGVRNKINALNSGSSATKVTASVLTSATGQKRLVVSADTVGSAGTGLTDGPEGVLRDLGFIDTKSRSVPSPSLAIAAALGITSPPPSSIRVNGRTITVDLAVDSISSIVSKIRAAGGQAESQTETVGGVPSSRLSVGGTVTATADPDSAATIAALGFAAGGQSSVQQVVASGNAFTDGGGGTATSNTLLADLSAGGTPLGVSVGDTLTFSGLRGDGSTVTTSFVVGGADTLQTLVSKLNDATTGFGFGSRPATATIDGDGRLRLNDRTGGESRLRLSMSVSPALGGTPQALLGIFGTETVGRARAMAVGSDAQLKVDGVLLTRPTNTVSDALDGVSINLLQAEAGTEIDFTVTRDLEASVKSIKDFAKAYNDVVSFSSGQQLDGQPLRSNTALRRILSSFTQALRTEVAAGGEFSRGTLAGVTLTRSGSLDVNDTSIRSALNTNLSGVQALFGSTGIGNAMSQATAFATRAVDGTITSALNGISNASTSLNKRISDAQTRVAARREALVARFTAMELAMNRLQQQGNSLTASVAGLNNRSN